MQERRSSSDSRVGEWPAHARGEAAVDDVAVEGRSNLEVTTGLPALLEPRSHTPGAT